MSGGRFNLGERAGPVFERLLDDQYGNVDPREREEAAAFWDWLGTFERPAEPERVSSRAKPLLARGTALVAAVAAACLVLVTAGVRLPWAGPTAASAAVTYTAGRGERRVIDMHDGSVITLAAESAIEVRYTGTARQVQLERGEALFKVAHNKSWPFIVRAAGGEVKAVGTAFDVALDGRSNAKVTVVEGVIRVAVSSANTGDHEQIARFVRKGEAVSFGVAPDQEARIGYIGDSTKADPKLATAWTRGMLYFHGEPLDEVVRTANRYAVDQITPPTGATARLRVYGIVAEGDTAALRELIAHPDGRSDQPAGQ